MFRPYLAPFAAGSDKRALQRNMTSHLVVTSEDESFVAAARYISELLDKGQVSRQACYKVDLATSQ